MEVISYAVHQSRIDAADPLAFGLPATVPFTRIGLLVRVAVTLIGVESDRVGKSDADAFKDRIEI